ncbi:hypothetical protein [Streptomyces sediminimaris]|uniref:hypothetical protein n=1 Tax=Streptomyces sediminimaris TaxID=3383721 RepID=UPI00399B2AA7
MKAILDALGIKWDSVVGRAWLAEVGRQHGYAHRHGLEHPSPVDEKLLTRVERLEVAFDAVLDRFDARYCAMADRLEALAATREPTKEHARQLRQEFPQDYLTLELFFDRLEGAAWLRPLQQKKFFTAPPGPVVDSDAGTITFPPWPASAYLVRVAAVDPIAVLDIASNIPGSDNPRVNLDLVEVALLVPASKFQRLVPRAVEALRRPYVIGEERYAQLARRCADHGQADDAIELMTALLDVDPQTHEASIDDYAYAEILQEHNVAFTRSLGVGWLEMLASLLDRSLGRDGLQAGRPGGEDLSRTWFAALENRPGSPHADLPALLTAAVRDSAEQLAEDGEVGLDAVLVLLGAYPWLVFRRLRLYLLERHGSQLPDVVQNLLTDPSCIQDRYLAREWMRLARAHAGNLPPVARGALLSAISAGPDDAWKMRYLTPGENEDLSADRLEIWTGLWRRDRYAAAESILTDEMRQQYEELCERFGSATSLDDVPENFRFYGPPSSSVTAGELSALNPVDLVARVSAWTPSETWSGTDAESFAAEFRSAVASQALTFSAQADLFGILSDEHLATVLGGFFDAAQNGVPVDWPPLCRLANAAVVRTGREHSNEVHRQAALMLLSGLSHLGNPIPAELSDSVWQSISSLVETPSPAVPRSLVDDDQQRLWSEAREAALRAAVAWACWRYRQGMDYSRFFNSLDIILSEVLPAPQRGGMTVATVIGSLINQLHTLDPIWVRSHLTLLSNTDPFGKIAWKAYLSSAQPTQSVAPLLLDTYRAAARTPISADSDYHRAALQRRLGEHLLSLYLRSQVELHDEQSPLAEYYSVSSAEIAQELAGSLGAAIQNNDLSEDTILRLQQWWDWRVANAADMLKRDQKSPFREELLTFIGPLVSSGSFSRQWRLGQLEKVFCTVGTFGRDPRIFKFLAAACETIAGPVMEFLKDWVLTLDSSDWTPRLQEAYLRTVLLTGLGTPDLRDLAEDIINRAAARGHRQFRPLLVT